MRLQQILKIAVRGGASDIFLKVGSVPKFRHNGRLVPLSDGEPVTAQVMDNWITTLLPENLKNQIKTKGSADFGFQMENTESRFRVNLFSQRGQYAIVMRVIKNSIQRIEDSGLPAKVISAADLKRGLVLVTGATGSGKSTTLAGLIQKINLTKAVHVLTIEDPIEFIYAEQEAVINQRELGEDTDSFATALKASLRQDPDVILVGELRDKETIETALMAAETGHLVFSTLHTKDAVDSLTRMMSYFPPHQHKSIRLQLADSLKMVISQRLVRKMDGKGMIAAAEILVVNSFVRDIILKEDHFEQIKDAIDKGQRNYGMQSFDQSLLEMYRNGIISREEAVSESSSRENMKLKLSGIE